MDTIDALLAEISVLNDLITDEQDDTVIEELKQERIQLVAQVNNLLGTDHILKNSRITTINNG